MQHVMHAPMTCEQVLQWLNFFVSDIMQVVAFAGNISTSQSLLCSLLHPLLFVLSILSVKKHPCRLLSISSYLLIDLIFKMDSHCTLLVLMWSSLYDRMYADDMCVCQ